MSQIKLGILGGGQLGAMLYDAAVPMGISFHVLDAADCPLAKRVEKLIEGATDDPHKTLELAKNCNYLTIEIEKVDVEALRQVERSGVPVYPPPDVIQTIQDKGKQKEFFQHHSIPSAKYVYADVGSPVPETFPLVQKIRRGGYDGRGVKVLKSPEDWANRLEGPSILEDKIAIQKEISVIIARGRDGETKAFAPVEMVFDPQLNLLDYLICPAQISEKHSQQATELALKTAEHLKIVGLLAVEMFLTEEGTILVNELAPRPHNSGHHTIEACETSQFTQHLRAILGMKLGSTKPRSPIAILHNLIGEPGHTGPAYAEGLDRVRQIPGVFVHLYGKAQTRPGRKMGHVTILSETPEEGKTKLEKVRKCLRIVAKKNPK